jgi:Arc/MetJ-type ribon-helix-helix transcriptional regulator
MKKAIRRRGGKRPGSGRKPTGTDPARTIRLSDQFLDKIDHWATQQEDQPSRSEAIRQLVELGLTIRKTVTQAPAARAARAKELAKTAIGKMTDATAPPDERAQRRHQLTKGPAEFREARIDQPKAKGK